MRDPGSGSRWLGALELIQLRVLHAIWRERSVGRASERLNLTSSAVSHNLAKIRDLVSDDLFVRGAGTMQPTPRMRDMAPLIEEIVERLEQLLDPVPFDPATSQRRFVIAALPYIATFFIPEVLAAVGRMAPEVQIRVISGGRSLVSDLEGRRVDLGVGVFGRLSPALEREPLFEDRFVIALARNHPLLPTDGGRPDLRRLSYVDVEISSEASEFNDPYYGADGMKRRITLDAAELAAFQISSLDALRFAAIVPDTSTALSLVERSEMAAIVVESAARRHAGGGLALIELASPPPRLPIERIRDRRTANDTAITWLARQMDDVARSWTRGS